MQNSWNSQQWLADFRAAAANRDDEALHRLRRDVYTHTQQVVQSDPRLVDIPPGLIYTDPPRLRAGATTRTTRFSVVAADGAEVAALVQSAGLRPALLNMANRQTPGGGVLSGAGAQEENLFRRSNLFVSLYPHEHAGYPLDRDHGGAYSPEAAFFRSSEASGYELLTTTLRLDVVSVPAVNRPEILRGDDGWEFAPAMIPLVLERMRAILRISARHGNDALVLSAFGCGAFRNPPGHTARLFRQVFEEPEFVGVFTLVVFAILEDHNAFRPHNPEGNFAPFQRVFG